MHNNGLVAGNKQETRKMQSIKLIIASLLLLVSTFIFAAEQLYTHQPTVTPELAFDGEYKVGVSTLKAVNPKQLSATNFTKFEDRELTLEVWYPAVVAEDAEFATYKDVTRTNKEFELLAGAYRDANPVKAKKEFPLIVFSHGYTGYRSIMFYLGEHLASHGYVVASIDHKDSTNADVIASGSPFSGFPSTLLNRARDQQFVLDYFSKLTTPLGRVVNTNAAVASGHSMGGYGTLNTVGGCYSFSNAAMKQFGIPEQAIPFLLPLFNTCNAAQAKVDPRWKGLMAFAPWGGEADVHDLDSLKNIKVPALYVAGDQDDVSGYENGVKKLFENTGTTSEEKSTYMLVFENARHNIVTHPTPTIAYAEDFDIGHYYEPSWDIETINRVNEHMVLAFLNCHVKDSKEACAYLPEREDVTQTKKEDGSLTEVWPGFKDRWGAGLKFYRK